MYTYLSPSSHFLLPLPILNYQCEDSKFIITIVYLYPSQTHDLVRFVKRQLQTDTNTQVYDIGTGDSSETIVGAYIALVNFEY